jgi:Putative GTPase activating protein for Arf
VQVRSVALDLWEPGWVKRMQAVGNKRANEVWEAKLRASMKLGPECLPQRREEFIRQKCIPFTHHEEIILNLLIYLRCL